MTSKKKILITGCAGFIGSHLTERLLSQNFKVVGFDNFDSFYARIIKENNLANARKNTNFEFIEGDITNITDINKIPNDIDIVIHLAAKAGVRPSIDDPSGYILTNILGTQLLLDWMKSKSIHKLIFASSSSVYGNCKKVPFSEDSALNEPISPYAFTKKSCELLNYTYHHLYDMSIVNLRFFTVYGPRQRPDLAIYKFVHLIKEGIPVPRYGDGKTSRDYTFIDDIVLGIESSINLISNSKTSVLETINLGNSTPISLNDLIKLLFELQGKEMNIEQLPMQSGDVNQTFANIERAKKLLNYSPSTSLEDGLKKFLNWFNSAVYESSK